MNDRKRKTSRTQTRFRQFRSSRSDNTIRFIRRIELANRFQKRFLRPLDATVLFDPKASRRKLNTRDVLELKPGDQVGDFLIDELIASGGEGSVYRAHDLKRQENVAVKILHSLNKTQRFHREMEMVQRLAHPNIVTAIQVGDFNGLPYIAMELLSGPDLYRQVRRNGPLKWQTSSNYVLQVARALAHAHDRDLMHHDVKPGNIIIDGETRVKLVDLGLASMDWAVDVRTVDDIETDGTPWWLDGDSLAPARGSVSAFAGTFHYLAPEQVNSPGNAEKCADIYSLGATWFYLLTGKERLYGTTVRELLTNLTLRKRFRELPLDSLPASLLRIYERMVAYDPCERYANCHDLISDLEDALTKEWEAQTEDTIEVLVVEDSRFDMLRTIGILRSSNRTLNIHQAVTLGEGLKLCSNQKIDLVLLDLNLPDSSGVETVRKFRDSAPEVPLIVLTGETSNETNQECLAAGCNCFISKDQTARTLERHIFVTLSRSRASH